MGVIPSVVSACVRCVRFPHTSGGDPVIGERQATVLKFSPRKWGYPCGILYLRAAGSLRGLLRGKRWSNPAFFFWTKIGLGKKKLKKLSIVVPCYNEEESIPLFYPAVEKVVNQMNDLQIEYWFVNDGSSDDSLAEMRKLHEQDPERVHYVSFSRNFGKEAGLYAGLQATTGDYVVVMDVDLQDPPEFLSQMYELSQPPLTKVSGL